MGTKTINYEFLKDDENEFYDVSRVNDNLNKIDTELKKVEDKVDDIAGEGRTVESVKGNADAIAQVDQALETHLTDYEEFRQRVEEPKIVTIGPTTSDLITLENSVKGQVNVELEGQTWSNLVNMGKVKEVINTDTKTLVKSSTRVLAIPSCINLVKDKTYTTLVNVTSMQNFINESKNFYLKCTGGDIETNIGNLTKGLNKLVFTASDNNTGLYFYISSAENENATVEFLRDIMIIEGDYSNKELYFIEGTKSTVLAQRIMSVGKNLFGNIITKGDCSITFDSTSNKWKLYTYGSTYVNSDDLNLNKFMPNQQYTISGYVRENDDSKNARLGIRYTDGTYDTCFTPTTSETYFSKTSSVGKTIDYIYWSYSLSGGTTYTRNLQLEEGSVATEYEEYTEDKTYILLEEDINVFSYADNGVDYGNWTIGGSGTTKGTNGIHLVADGTNEFATINLNFKPNTKYTIAIRINSENTQNDDALITSTYSAFGQNKILNKVGTHTISLTTLSSIEYNQLRFIIDNAESEGNYVDFEVLAILEGDYTTGEDANLIPYHKLAYGNNNLKIPAKARSLPNGVRDRLYYSNGKYYFEKNTEKKILQASDVSFRTSGTNVEVYQVMLSDAVFNGNSDTFTLETFINIPDSSTTWDDTAYVGKIYSTSRDKNIRIILAKDTTLEQAQSQLAGLTLIYQLAESKTYEIEGVNSIQSFDGITHVTFEPVVRFEEIADQNGEIITPYSQINFIESVHEKILDGEGIRYVDASYSQVDNVTVGGLTYGKKYRITYHYPKELTTSGIKTIKYSVNIAATIEGVLELQKRLKQELGTVWLTLLPVADKELGMYMITEIATPATASSENIANKVNEILQIWKGR